MASRYRTSSPKGKRIFSRNSLHTAKIFSATYGFQHTHTQTTYCVSVPVRSTSSPPSNTRITNASAQPQKLARGRKPLHNNCADLASLCLSCNKPPEGIKSIAAQNHSQRQLRQ